LATAPLFIAECPGVGSGGFGVEDTFPEEIGRLFRMALNALRRRDSSKKSLNTARTIKQSPGSACPQVEHNFA
jgi:hypothetical protein